MKNDAIMTAGLIEQRIFVTRGMKVLIDRDIAELYDVETKYLNRQVKRNPERFPMEFVFQLTRKEKAELVTNWHRFASLKHSSTLPFAFTEHGIAMLATVLKSDRAIRMSILIVKTFVRLREIIASHKELSEKFQLLENRLEKHDQDIQAIVEAIRRLLEPPEKPSRSIGFKVSERIAKYEVPRKKSK
ncbi:MAG TPA: ORF6N domain-containing protein [Bacteroidota bacterium]|nr:ORF6N domain-containing protein [Bacteroidota bacterium]